MKKYICIKFPQSISLIIFLFSSIIYSSSNSDRFTKAYQAESTPIIDGDILNDPAWVSIPAIKTFTQKSPDEGQIATEITEVRVMYSDKIFYVSVVCYDSSPEGIVTTDTRRDAPLNNTDSFMFILDTFKDQQNGYVFGTNAVGIEYDAQVSKGGEMMSISSSRQSVGTGAAFNINWDAVWDVEAQVGEYGWSAEFAIPFKTLRYASKKNQEWGINFQRTIARKKEVVYWSPIPRQFSLNRLLLAGTIQDINVPSTRNLKIMPYGLGQQNKVINQEKSSTDKANDLGIDAKLGLTSSLTLDMTYNTDFAQVEVDEQQINLDRYSLFFPEKRTFFLENAGLFSVGENTYYGPDIEIFFSRRIGIGAGGEQVPILGGGRLTGTLAGMKMGMLSMRTKAVEDVTNSNNYSVFRLKKELPNRTSFGFITTDRTGLGDDGYSNRAYAIDGALGIGEATQLIGFAAKTDPPLGIEGDAGSYAYMLEANRNTQAFTTQIRYSEVGQDFNPEIGYVKRLGYKKVLFRILNRTRPKDLFGLLEIRPHITYYSYWKLDGFQETGYLHIDSHWEFRNGFRIDTGINFRTEGVSEAFEIVEGTIVPKGTFNNKEIHIRTNTNLTKPLSVTMTNTIGGFFSGNRRNTNTTLRFRFGDRFTSDLISRYNDVDLPEGQFVTHLIRSRLTYAISPEMYIQSLLQYNNQSDQWSMNWRFIWQQSAATGLYVVYNQTEDYDGIPIASSTKSFVVKYSYLFDVLN